MNHHEDSNDPFASQQIEHFTKAQQIVSCIAILILGYYAVSFLDAWPSTIRRNCYELTIRLIPSSFVYALQYVMISLGRMAQHEATFRRSDFGDFKLKEEALNRIFGKTSIPLVLQRARTLSGYNRFPLASGEISPPGLGNWDNSCYQNSILQGFASLPAFRDYVHRNLLLCRKTNTPGHTTEALDRFLDQLADASCQRTTIWTPAVLKSMDSWQQQDAQEYFSRVTDAVEKEALQYMSVLRKRMSSGLNDLPVERISQLKNVMQPYDAVAMSLRGLQQTFMNSPIDGLEAQALTCQTCHFSEGISLTNFNCLTLNLGLGTGCRLSNLLDAYTEPELIEGVECDQCTRCGDDSNEQQEHSEDPIDPGSKDTVVKPSKKAVLRTKAKQLTLARLPRDLVIHINRSMFDDFGNQKKNVSPVEIPPQLDFQARWCAPIGVTQDTIQAVYKLKGMVTHSGRHDNGHYVAFGLREKEWYCFNDETVTKLTEAEVVTRGNAFMLFYEALDVTEMKMTEEPESFDDAAVKSSGSRSNTDSSSASEAFEQFDEHEPHQSLPAMRTASGPLTGEAPEGLKGSVAINAV